MMVNREAIILNYAASAAWKFHDLFGVGVTLEWIAVPRLDYSLVINANPAPGAANPVSSPYDILAQTTGSDPFTFNAIVGAWFRPAPSLQFGLAGQVVPANIVTHSTLALTALDPATLLGTITTVRNGVPANDVTVTLPLPLLVRGGGRYRHLAAGRELFDLELDVEYETWSRAKAFTVDSSGLVANALRKPARRDRDDHRPQAVERRAQRQAGRRLQPGARALDDARRGLLRDRRVAVGVRQRRLSRRRAAGRGARHVDACCTAGSWPSPTSCDTNRASPLRRRTRASTSRRRAAPASPPTPTDICNAHYLGQPAPAVNAGTYAATSHLVSLAVVYRYGR